MNDKSNTAVRRSARLEESPSRGSLYNKIARLALPFQNFGRAFSGATRYRKVAMILNLLFAGVGSFLIGEIEIGLAFLAAYGALGFLFVYVIQSLATGVIAISGFDAFLVLAIVFFGFVCVWYASFSKSTADQLRLQKGTELNGSYIVNFFRKKGRSFSTFRAEYGAAFHRSESRTKSRLIYSWFIMGIALCFYQHAVKGIFLFLAQVLWIFYMIARGASDLLGLFTLRQPGVMSSATLVYGLLAALLLAFFIALYIMNITSLVKAVDEESHGKRGPGARGEFSDLINEKFYITGLIVPVLGALFFTIIPLLFMIFVAFTNYSGKAGTGGVIPNPIKDIYLSWTGSETFIRLFGNPDNLRDMLSVFSWTMIWAICATFTCYFGGLFLAMLLNKKCIKGKVVYRSLLVISMALPQFVSLLVVRTMFMDNGPVNMLLKDWGWISWMQQQGWISAYDDFIPFWRTPGLAKTLIILINMWVGIPYYMLLMSGLLINIPGDFYEAASIEGATKGQQFRMITFPYILHMTAPMLITSFVSNINNFNVIWFLVGNADGQADSTDILITWLYKITMKGYLDYNLGAAIGIVMFIITASVSLIVYRRSNSFKNEEEFR